MASEKPVAGARNCTVEEETTTVRVPMLRPCPDLLAVLHLGGGVGETYTMREIIGHVREYIQERKLYDEQDPSIVHCAGDLLGKALGVDSFTVFTAISLFRQNCCVEPDSCIHIRRHLVTRPVNSQSQVSGNSATTQSTLSSSAGGTASSSNAVEDEAIPKCRSESMDIPPEISGSSSVSGLLETVSSSYSSSVFSSSQPSSSATSVLDGTEKSPVLVTDLGLDMNGTCQMVTSTESSSDGDGRRKSKNPKRKTDENHPPRSGHRKRSTSVNVTCDEVDGASGPWTCQVMVETSGGETVNAEDDTVVVEFESDTFSVEYELESNSDVEQQGVGNDTGQQRDLGCSESDVSSTTAATAFLVVCQESDVEYLADYSDSDFGSDTELSNADKWNCDYCNIQNPPFQRNCAGCWSVRPDWLPPMLEKEADVKVTHKEQCIPSCQFKDCETIGSQCAGSSLKLSMEVDKKQDCCLSEKVDSFKSVLNATNKKRKHSSGPDSSDSPEDMARTMKQRPEPRSLKRANSVDEFEKTKKKIPLPSSGANDPCVVCLSRSKTASIIHGKTGHQVCCYRCAKRLKKQRRACPICRRPIQKVIRNYYL